MAQKTYVEPIKYVVGKDITEERYQEAIQKIGDWFAESRLTREPVAAARTALQECLDGVTKDGKPWFAAALVPLDKRVKAKCRFDLATMTPLRKGTEKTRIKKQQQRERDARKRARAADDPLIPEDIRKGLRKGTAYGDDPSILLSTAEDKRWKALSKAYKTQFPELATVNAEAELNMLCDMHILQERNRMKVLSGQPVDPEQRDKLADSLQKLKRALGIHPDQLAKRVKEKEDASVSSAVARLEAMGNWREIRAGFFIEEMIQAYQMYMSLTADGSGYQLDEVGLFGMTKCRTCACAKCGHRNFAGISIEEVERFLVDKGALEPLPEPVPEAQPDTPTETRENAVAAPSEG